MGLDAFVRCNCYEEGKAKPFIPNIELYYDDDNYIDVVRTPNMSEEEYIKLSNDVYKWSRNCCEHRYMHCCRKRVGSWADIRSFTQALEAFDCFNTLLSIIPSGNGGYVKLEQAKAALKEISFFAEKIGEYANTSLLNKNTGSEVYHYIARYNGEFAWSKKANQIIGLDADGLFVKKYNSGREIFRSMNFTQQVFTAKSKFCIKHFLGKQVENKKGRPEAVISDTSSGKSVKIFTAIADSDKKVSFEVIKRKMNINDFYAYLPLKSLLEASLETGNQIVWC